MLEVAEIFRRYGADYLERFGTQMLPSHRRAWQAIVQCRTEAMGGHLAQCPHCAALQYSYHSCRNRSCPKCHRNDTLKWLEKRRTEILPVPYFHAVFTLPKELRELVRSHQRELYEVLLKAASRSLMQLAADPRYVGGTIGMLCVLHTWTRAMLYHPHVHCLIPAGGLSCGGERWLPARSTFLVPVSALSKLFRGKFMDLLHKALPWVTVPQSVWKTKWVVHCKPSVQGVERTLNYLARYVSRMAITNNRIFSIHQGNVTFHYRDSRDYRSKSMTLPAQEFIRRFLQHTLPQRFHKVRHYGLLSPANRHRLAKLAEQLTAEQPHRPSRSCHAAGSHQVPIPPQLPYARPCPLCGQGLMILIRWLPRPKRAPP